MMKYYFLVLFILIGSDCLCQTFLFTSKCQFNSKVKIWINSKFVNTFEFDPFEERWIDLPEEGWIWIESYPDLGKNYKTKDNPKSFIPFKFVEDPKDLNYEFNGYIDYCPCSLIGA